MRTSKPYFRHVVVASLLACATSGLTRADIIYVKAGAAGLNDGTSWENAYTSLQSALTAAVAGDEIWVAAGVYTPTSPGDRSASFVMKSGVALYGGLAGNESSGFDLAWRSFAAHPTTLSGDLLGDDGPDFANTADNSYSVVTGEMVDASAIVDGFIITGGEATAPDSQPTAGSSGGGMFLSYATPIIRNCRFVRNRAWVGGGAMGNLNSSPAVSRCLFDGNRVLYGSGGAVLNFMAGTPEFRECTFLGNAAVAYGGALFNVAIRANVLGCAFRGNTSGASAGAVYELMSISTFTNCLFTGNRAESQDTPPIETNGGALVVQQSSTMLINCTLRKNAASYGGGVVNTGSGTFPTILNSILWDNPGGEFYVVGLSQPAFVVYSNVKGGATGLGNINANPLFADADGPDGIVGTLDDNLHLLPGSPCIDAGRNAEVPPGVLTDLGGAVRFFDDSATADCRWVPGTCGTAPVVDMGAYEFFPAPCDSDHDADVDAADLLAFEACASGPAIPHTVGCAEWDFDGDHDVDQADFGIVQRCYSGENQSADPDCAD
jgi:hypothetical protein